VQRLSSVGELDFGKYVGPGGSVLWGQACAEPRTLVRHLLASHGLPEITAFIGIPVTDLLAAAHASPIRLTSYTGAGVNSVLHASGGLDIMPVHYSSIPNLIARGRIRADTVLVQVAGPGKSGRYSLGAARDYLVAAIERADTVIAEVSSGVPWTYGPPYLTEDDITVLLPSAEGPAELLAAAPSPVQEVIATYAADLVEDGATIQVGVGSLADAVLARLASRRHLGVHSGQLTDGMVDLIEGGAVTGERKRVDRGLVIGGLLYGSSKLFSFADRNKAVCLRDARYTHDPVVLAVQYKFTALNSALEVDLTGQVNAEVARGRYIGSVGGAVDFLRGAAASPGGLPVVMLPATAGPASRVVMQLNGPVSTPRSDAGVVVTEHGVADLRGLTLAERAERMIAIAAPQFRDSLSSAADAALSASKGARSL